jgi:hypothetical protein
MNEWIGVDLDGTLAFYRGPMNGAIGTPIPIMVGRVKKWLREGKNVKIVTARVSSAVPDDIKAQQISAIQKWSVEHIGRTLLVTAEKDRFMVELWDDRVQRVERNTGRML